MIGVPKWVADRVGLHHRQTHFFATVAVVGGTTATIIRDGQTVADTQAYPFLVGLGLTAADRVIVIDPTGDGTGLTIIGEMP